jgi:hypothetical protein
MPCHAMHPIQDLFLEGFSYVLQFDMHFYMHSYLDKKIIPVKSGCYIMGGGGKLGELDRYSPDTPDPQNLMTRGLGLHHTE